MVPQLRSTLENCSYQWGADMSLRKVTCQYCGAKGEENNETDLMPNTCVTCFADRVRPIFEKTQSIGELYQGLVDVGCLPDRLYRHLEHLFVKHTT